MGSKTGSILHIDGLDLSRPADYINASSSPELRNVTISKSIIESRYGVTICGDQIAGTPTSVMAIRQLSREQTNYLVRIGLDKIEQFNNGTSVWDDITGTDLTGSITDTISTATPLLSAQRVLVFTNFIDNIRKYIGSGNTADLGGSPPKAKYVLEFGDYLLLAYINDGSNIRGSRVQWCDTGDIENWSTGNSGAKDLVEDGSDVTGLASFGVYCTVHTSNSIYVGYPVTSSDTLRFDRKATGIGTVCDATIQNIPNFGQLFLAVDGVRKFDGSSASLVQSPFNDEIRESINLEYIHKCWSVVVAEKSEYWVGVTLGSDEIPSVVYRYNYETGVCLKDSYTDIVSASMFNVSDALTWDTVGAGVTWDNISTTLTWDDLSITALAPTLMLGDTNGYTFKRDKLTYDDNGVAVDSYIETKDYTILDLDDRRRDHGLLVQWGVSDEYPDRSMEIWAKGSSLEIDYSIDSGATWTSVGTATLTGDYPTDIAPVVQYFDVLSSQIRFRFRNQASEGFFAIKQFIIRAEVREMRG